MEKNILVFCAHADDEVIGCGGTIAKYAKEGKNVIVVVFSYGETSSPLIQKKITIESRVEETKLVSNMLGVKQSIFLGLPDAKIILKVKDKEVINSVRKIIKEYHPEKIFAHSPSDIHTDHQAVYSIVNKALENLDYPLYLFTIWSPFNMFKRNSPKLYVDISETMDLKIQALKSFESQLHFIYILLPFIKFKAKIHGLLIKKKYVEKFYKVK